jgi:hypothetical protein
VRHSLPPQGPPAGLWRRSDGVARSQAFRGELGGDRGSGPQVRDPDYRVEVAEYGVHIYDHDGHHVSDNPFKLFPRIGPEADIGHAFYLVIETARAENTFRLAKRYAQDEPAPSS